MGVDIYILCCWTAFVWQASLVEIASFENLDAFCCGVLAWMVIGKIVKVIGYSSIILALEGFVIYMIVCPASACIMPLCLIHSCTLSTK